VDVRRIPAGREVFRPTKPREKREMGTAQEEGRKPPADVKAGGHDNVESITFATRGLFPAESTVWQREKWHQRGEGKE